MSEGPSFSKMDVSAEKETKVETVPTLQQLQDKAYKIMENHDFLSSPWDVAFAMGLFQCDMCWNSKKICVIRLTRAILHESNPKLLIKFIETYESK